SQGPDNGCWPAAFTGYRPKLAVELCDPVLGGIERVQQNGRTSLLQGGVDAPEPARCQASLVGQRQRFAQAPAQQVLDAVGQLGRNDEAALEALGEGVLLDGLGDRLPLGCDPNAASGKTPRQVRHDLAARTLDEAQELLRRTLQARDDARAQGGFVRPRRAPV